MQNPCSPFQNSSFCWRRLAASLTPHLTFCFPSRVVVNLKTLSPFAVSLAVCQLSDKHTLKLKGVNFVDLLCSKHNLMLSSLLAPQLATLCHRLCLLFFFFFFFTLTVTFPLIRQLIICVFYLVLFAFNFMTAVSQPFPRLPQNLYCCRVPIFSFVTVNSIINN